MSSDRYPPGFRVIFRPARIIGTVVPNYKLPGDICVDWDNGQKSSYDEEFLDDNCRPTDGSAFPIEPMKEETLKGIQGIIGRELISEELIVRSDLLSMSIEQYEIAYKLCKANLVYCALYLRSVTHSSLHTIKKYMDRSFL